MTARLTSALFTAFSLLVLGGCSYFESGEERKAIAKAGQHVLYQDELAAVLPQGLTMEDSTLFADNHIRQWATKRLMVDRAELNLSEQQKDVSRQLEEYRQSLLLYLYQTEWVRQQMDTLVSEEEIAEYHAQHSVDFTLQEDIVRALLIKVSLNDPETDNLRKWIRKDDDPELRSVLEAYCTQHALAMHLNDQQWVQAERLMRLLPSNSSIPAWQLRQKGLIEVTDSTARYLVDIKEVMQKNTIAPVDYVSNSISSMILNRRKLDMMRQLERDIYEQAVNKGQVKLLD